jgi:uncharacterized protein DUF4157
MGAERTEAQPPPATVRAPEPDRARPGPGTPARVLGNGLVQRCGGMPEPCPCHEEDGLQRHADGAAPARVPPIVSEVVAGPGAPLPAGLRMSMQRAFALSGAAISGVGVPPGLTISDPGDAGERQAAHVAARVVAAPDGPAPPGPDFGDVRVHTDARAAESARAVAATAYTLGQHIVFGAGAFTPETAAGRTLLAHELTHVVQQRGAGHAVQRQGPAAPEACPVRPAGEAAQSRTPAGILPSNVELTGDHVDIVDFAVHGRGLPPDVLTHPDWQRAMSLIAGDPSMKVGVAGFTDCVGGSGENLTLRRQRTASVLAAMPPEVSSTVLFSFTVTASDYRDTNTTADGRAHNRAVRIIFRSIPPRGVDACDVPTAARTLDEYLFLVRCLEKRLGLTAPGDVRTALSVLRQVYFGSGTWSLSRNPVWDNVITGHPWAPGTDPTTGLHPPLMAALQHSQVVEGTDMGHLLTGLDAMLAPAQVVVTRGRFGLQTGLANEEWATWAGDVGSAAAEWAMANFMTFGPVQGAPIFFGRFASDSDLVGDIDAFAVRVGLGGGPPPAALMRPLVLNAPLSEVLMQYFRITSTGAGTARGTKIQDFVTAYGGTVTNRRITNRPAFFQRLRPSVDEFARLFSLQLLITTPGQPPPGGQQLGPLLDNAIDTMTVLFVDWLEARL